MTGYKNHHLAKLQATAGRGAQQCYHGHMVEPIILPTSALIQSKIILQRKSKGLENFFSAFKGRHPRTQRPLSRHADSQPSCSTHRASRGEALSTSIIVRKFTVPVDESTSFN